MFHDELKQAAADFIGDGYWNTDYVTEFAIAMINRAREEAEDAVALCDPSARRTDLVLAIRRALKIEEK